MELIYEAKQKNPDAFDKLMQTKLQKMYRIAISILCNEDDAADAIQETVLKVWESMDKLRKPEFFDTWLTKILINECNNIYRMRRKTVSIEEMPESAYEDAYFKDEWRSLIELIGEKYRPVLELFYVDGYSTREIALLLHITEANVRSRLSRGRKQLAEILRNEAI